MKPLVVLLTLAALCVGGAGCDKPEADAGPGAFDEAIDGTIPTPTVSVDDSVLKARPKVQAGQPAPTVQPTGTTGAPVPAPVAAGTPEEQVREVLKSSVAGLKSGDYDSFLDAYVDEQAEALRPMFEQANALFIAIARLADVAERKLGASPMDQLFGQFGPGAGGGMTAVDAMPLQVVSDTEVQALGPQGQPQATALLIDGQWRLKMADEGLQQVVKMADNPMLGELVTALTGACDELSDGLENGSITQANFQQSAQALMEQKVMPAMVGFAAAMMASEMGAAMQETATTPEEPAAEPFKVTDPDDPYGGPLPDNPYGPAGGGGQGQW